MDWTEDKDLYEDFLMECIAEIEDVSYYHCYDNSLATCEILDYDWASLDDDSDFEGF